MTNSSTIYLSYAETAKLLRAAFKETFPKQECLYILTERSMWSPASCPCKGGTL